MRRNTGQLALRRRSFQKSFTVDDADQGEALRFGTLSDTGYSCEVVQAGA